ncbi:MAG: hypothetical protein MRK02_11445 [Candidatus Scalindua sp.]|nr:hypothetical protein [Candidatus Scalindua sp.]
MKYSTEWDMQERQLSIKMVRPSLFNKDHNDEAIAVGLKIPILISDNRFDTGYLRFVCISKEKRRTVITS